MRLLHFTFYLLFATWVNATTLQIEAVWQALSLHGTDSDSLPDGFSEPVQARIMSRPLILQGAMPESLVAAIAAPTQLQVLPSSAEIENSEANLVVLCGIELQPELEQNGLKIAVNVSDMKIPAQVRLSEDQVVRLIVSSLEKTLRDHYRGLFVQRDDEDAMEVRIHIIGTGEKNAELMKLGKKFEVGE